MLIYLAAAILLGLAAFLAVFVVKSDRGAKEPLGGLVVAFFFGVLAIVLALFIEKWLIPFQSIRDVFSGHFEWTTLAWVSLTVGVVEETVKFLPLAIFIRHRKYFNEHNDGLIYFAMSGIAFGLIENFYYLANLGPGVGLMRAGLLLFFHPAASATVGYFYARSVLDRKPLWQTGWALLGVALLHGLYNFGVASRSWPWVAVGLMVTAALNTGLFLFYRRATELDQAAGMAATGENKFCRHCGAPNPEQFLYCEHCGKQA